MKFEGLSKEEVMLLEGMIDDISDDMEKLKGFTANRRLIEKYLNVSEDTHRLVHNNAVFEIKYKFPGETKHYYYELLSREAAKVVFGSNSNRELCETMTESDLGVFTKVKLNKIYREISTLEIIVFQYIKDLLRDVVTFLIRRGDNDINKMILADNGELIVTLMFNVYVELLKNKPNITSSVSSLVKKLNFGYTFSKLLKDMFENYNIFGKNNDKIVKGLDNFIKSRDKNA